MNHTDVESFEQFNPYLLSELDSDKSDNETTQASHYYQENILLLSCVLGLHMTLVLRNVSAT